VTKVLKIGGSILTDKSRELTARPDEIRRVAEEIASCPDDVVLVHGAGSFGHFPAKKYGLPHEFSRQGLRVTHSCVAKLSEKVVEALSLAGVDCLPVHPLSCLLLRDGRIDSFFMEPIKEMLKNGIMPVLHGDVAMDATGKAGIVSGDQLVPYLAKALAAEIVAMGFDKDGVIVSGRTLPMVTRQMLPEIESALGGSAGVDVTGGMKEKLLELLALADEGIESLIFNAADGGSIEKILKGESVGTRVTRSN
jgi:isopentenyl phosphate kinase